MKIIRSLLKISLELAAIFILAIFILRAYHGHKNEQALAIRSPDGIDEAMYVKIGGIEQWIQIRGQNRANPVLLCVHGGPGGTWIPLTGLFTPWEKDFTVVLWDQRGAGKTLESTGASIAETMSVDRMSQDGIEVAEFLRDHLHQPKIFLLGHSWGSILGIHMAKLRPDLFYAYAGTGQVSDMPRGQRIGYDFVLAKARAAKDRHTAQAFENIGPPPYDDMRKIGVFFTGLDDYEIEKPIHSPTGTFTSPAPHYSVWDEVERRRGFLTVPTLRVYREMLSTNLADFATSFQIPIFFFQGTEDERTPASLAREYFDTIQAPRKEMVMFEGAGHFAVWSMRDEFLKELDRRVRPLVEKTP